MKIAVLGTGTVGVMSVLHFLRYMPNSKVHCIFNPEKDILGIGESSNIQLPQLLWESVNYNTFGDSEEIDSTIKFGVLYKNWRENDFISPILPNQYAMHFNNFNLSNSMFKRAKNKYGKRFKIIHKNVKNYQQSEKEVTVLFDESSEKYDYVIDCRGYPEDYSDYHICNTLPLNRCFVNMIKEPGNWAYTYHQAHENGWMFGIPLTTRQGWGYLFNDEITTEEEAIKNINKIFKSNLKKKDLRDFKFKAYRANKFLNHRVIRNGNRAIFYEPMEALSGTYYDNVNRFFYDYINNNMTEEGVNDILNLKAKQYENFICYMYSNGSIYQTDFWKKVKHLSNEHLDINKNMEWKDTLSQIAINEEALYFTWPFYLKSWNCLMKGFKND